jgi:hypothetical protein
MHATIATENPRRVMPSVESCLPGRRVLSFIVVPFRNQKWIVMPMTEPFDCTSCADTRDVGKLMIARDVVAHIMAI